MGERDLALKLVPQSFTRRRWIGASVGTAAGTAAIVALVAAFRV